MHAPLDLVRAVTQTDGKGPCVIDCLTLWLSNLMLAGQDTEVAADALVASLASRADPVILVTMRWAVALFPKMRWQGGFGMKLVD